MTHQPKPILKSAIANPIADLLGGWPTPLKNIFISWDDFPFPIWWESRHPFQNSMVPHHQTVFFCVECGTSNIIQRQHRVWTQRYGHQKHRPIATSLGPWIPWMNFVGFRPVVGVQVYGLWSGWWYTYPSEKYESQMAWWHSQYMEK